jgi:hypothetical protein
MYLSTALPNHESILTHLLMATMSTTYQKPDHVLAAHGSLISMDFDMMFNDPGFRLVSLNRYASWCSWKFPLFSDK